MITLISETPENMILQRDIYDRDMINTWGIDRVTLLGDAAHPMQPNLGQGGCMAIEVGHLQHSTSKMKCISFRIHNSGSINIYSASWISITL